MYNQSQMGSPEHWKKLQDAENGRRKRETWDAFYENKTFTSLWLED